MRVILFETSVDGHRARYLRETIVGDPCDRLTIACRDGLIFLMGILRRWLVRGDVPESIQIESMLFRPKWVYESQRPTQWLYRQLRRLAVGRWPGWRFYDSAFKAWDRVPRSVDRYQHAEASPVPEVFQQWELSSKADAIGWLKSIGYLSGRSSNLNSNTPVVTLPGFPERRKGAVELIEALVRDKRFEGVLLLWGSLPKNVQHSLDQRGIQWKQDLRILFVQKHVDDAAFEALFSVAELIVLPYQFHFLGGASL